MALLSAGSFFSRSPTWLCDRRGCPRKTTTERDPAMGRSPWRPVEDGWWECRGVHLCPTHNPEEVPD